jgi:transposase InsO family protein
MEQREKFIQETLKKDKPFKQLCLEYGISEKTGYKWKNRFFEEGNKGLYDKSKAPANSPNSLSEDVVIDIITIKSAHLFWGAKKILAIYQKQHKDSNALSLSSVNRILSKANLVKKRRVKHVTSDSQRLRQYIKPEKPNDVWAIDFKGWWKSDGEVCEPFTVRDLSSRKLLDVRLMRSKDSVAVRAVMTELFKKYGLPKVIRSDNGIPFSSPNGLLSITCLSAWWITLGILPDRTDKGCPGQNGSLERMHADIAREIQGKICGGIAANQAALDIWRQEYNDLRPNEAIGMLTPSEVYTPSDRKYSGDYDDIEYPIGFLSRKVLRSGEIAVFGFRVTIGSSLRGLTVGLHPVSDHFYDVFLADFLLGKLDMTSCCFTPLDSL